MEADRYVISAPLTPKLAGTEARSPASSLDAELASAMRGPMKFAEYQARLLWQPASYNWRLQVPPGSQRATTAEGGAGVSDVPFSTAHTSRRNTKQIRQIVKCPAPMLR